MAYNEISSGVHDIIASRLYKKILGTGSQLGYSHYQLDKLRQTTWPF